MRLNVSSARTITLLFTLLGAAEALAQDVVPPSSLQGLLAELAVKVNIAAGAPPSAANAVEGIGFDARIVGLEISTAPYGTSGGGFTYTFDKETGTFVRLQAQSFGPAFGKRAVTIGKGHASVGFNWVHANYDSLAGLSLSNGDYRPVQNVGGTPGGYSSLIMDLSSDAFVSFASFGLARDLDVGVAVPWIRVSLFADVGLFLPEGDDVTPGGHLLVLPRTTAAGVGDIAIYGKYRFWRQGEGGLAGEVEVRLPTGDPADLRGAGVTRTLVSAIWSRGGRISPHANIGYEFWSDDVSLGPASIDGQIVYGFGLEVQAHQRATVLLDIVGRRLMNGGRFGYVPNVFESVITGPTTSEVLAPLPESLDVVSFAPGVKWNVAGNVLLTGNVLAAITNDGLRADVIPVVGVDWAF